MSIEFCEHCGERRLGGTRERGWCMNTDCAYTWVIHEHKLTLKERLWLVRRWYLETLFRIYFAIVRLTDKISK